VQGMKRKERYIASLDEVIITRDGDYALIAYKEEGVGATHLQIGPEIAEMSDTEILELHNRCLQAQAKRAVEYKHVAIEVPLGSPVEICLATLSAVSSRWRRTSQEFISSAIWLAKLANNRLLANDFMMGLAPSGRPGSIRRSNSSIFSPPS
jgi:hypothetical protein